LSIGERIPEEEKDLPEQKVIDASHGQYLLYTLWQHHLRDRTRESLVTHDDLKDFQRRRKLFDGYDSMLDRKIIPIINEDDRRSIEEIDIMLKGERVFRDNDGLASLIASQMSEDNHKVLLVILSNTDGIYTKESCKDNLFTPIRIIEDPENLEEQIFFTTSKRSRGGMISKIEAAKEAAMHGVYVVIANGQYCNHDARFQDGLVKERKYKVLEAILNGYVVGTRFVPARQ
ncbi:MAG: hypothetical protein NT001_03550, partial [Candidatus Woesearchaeota archaeon]|nr:hypothetical protein [Candidatus Woesearchaeota archaeon]